MSTIRVCSAAIAVALLMPAASFAQAGCTQDVLTLRGTPVTVAYCVDGPVRSIGPDEIAVPVYATFTTPSVTFSRRRQLHFFAGERVSRVVDNLRLERIAMSGVLHLTLSYTRGVVLLEGALLSPGGITIK